MKNIIKNDMILAMRVKNVVARDILRVLIAEIQRKEQTKDGKVELSDAETLKIIKKMIDTAETPGDKVVLEGYMPQQMDENDIIIEATIFIDNSGLDSPRDMGKVMGYFKQNFDGTYDGKVLSGIVKELLS